MLADGKRARLPFVIANEEGRYRPNLSEEIAFRESLQRLDLWLRQMIMQNSPPLQASLQKPLDLRDHQAFSRPMALTFPTGSPGG